MSWKCVECQETVDDDMDVCWNCGTDRAGVKDPNFQSADDMGALRREADAGGEEPHPPGLYAFGLGNLLLLTGQVIFGLVVFAGIVSFLLRIVRGGDQERLFSGLFQLLLASVVLALFVRVRDLSRRVESLTARDDAEA